MAHGFANPERVSLRVSIGYRTPDWAQDDGESHCRYAEIFIGNIIWGDVLWAEDLGNNQVGCGENNQAGHLDNKKLDTQTQKTANI